VLTVMQKMIFGWKTQMVIISEIIATDVISQ
jgi:hypothetical protein